MQAAGAEGDIGDRLAGVRVVVGKRNIGAHLFQGAEQTGAQRVEPDMAHGDFGSLRDQRRDARKRRR